jgi:hypothetical protein
LLGGRGEERLKCAGQGRNVKHGRNSVPKTSCGKPILETEFPLNLIAMGKSSRPASFRTTRSARPRRLPRLRVSTGFHFKGCRARANITPVTTPPEYLPCSRLRSVCCWSA